MLFVLIYFCHRRRRHRGTHGEMGRHSHDDTRPTASLAGALQMDHKIATPAVAAAAAPTIRIIEPPLGPSGRSPPRVWLPRLSSAR